MDTRIDQLVDGTTSVAVRRTGQSGPWGETMGFSHPDLRWEVRDEILEEILARKEAGKVEVGGQTYRWWLTD